VWVVQINDNTWKTVFDRGSRSDRPRYSVWLWPMIEWKQTDRRTDAIGWIILPA